MSNRKFEVHRWKPSCVVEWQSELGDFMHQPKITKEYSTNPFSPKTPLRATKSQYDQYADLSRISEQIYRNVAPAKAEVQTRLTPYEPKPFGEKRTYQQDWPLYERACSEEKLMFLRILKAAVEQLNLGYLYKGNGRPHVDYSDIIKALCIKSYNNYSSWRAESELRIAQAMGIIDEVPKRSTINKYMRDDIITTHLHDLYKAIAEPLAGIELKFAADATGISNKYGNVRWMRIRHTREEEKHRREYSKLHIISGVKTNVICSATITAGTSHESPHFKGLLNDTATRYRMREVLADAGYLSKDNVRAITKVGAVPFIQGKRNANVPAKSRSSWGYMLRLWKHHQMFFAQHYHQRSNVESTFGALKRKFGDFTRCKKPESQENEILCKIVCFNSAVLAEALLSYDLKGDFIASL